MTGKGGAAQEHKWNHVGGHSPFEFVYDCMISCIYKSRASVDSLSSKAEAYPQREVDYEDF